MFYFNHFLCLWEIFQGVIGEFFFYNIIVAAGLEKRDGLPYCRDDERAKLNQKEILNLLSYVFLHEFTHILGFTESILSYKGLLITKNVTRIEGNPKNKTLFIGNKAIETASSYFNCNKIEGIELDSNSNSEKLPNSHWNARILLGDYMISGKYYPEQVISEITLALLEDLGWYKINYYTGGLMRFGKNKGCEFLEKDCIKSDGNDVVSSFPNEFCSPNSFSTCSSGRLSRGYCFKSASENSARTYAYRAWIHQISAYSNKQFNQFGKE